MRKIAILGIVLLSVAAFGCSKKPAENSETQMAPAPATQEAAPATQEAAPAAPAQGMGSSNETQPESTPSENKDMPPEGAKTDGAAK
jgi:hypothetical protein